MGSPEFAVPSLERLVADGHEVAGVYTQPDRAAGRGRSLTPPPVKVCALELGLPVFQPATLRHEPALRQLAALAPNLIVVAAFGQILRQPVLDIPSHGVINVHASLLPRWRGAAPIPAAILAGDRETGISIMQIDPGLDTGPVLARRSIRISDFDSAGSVTVRLAALGAELLSETLPAWLDGALLPEPQDSAGATYAPRIEKDSGRIDWTHSAAEIWRRVRAFHPWPGAFTSLHGVPLRLLECWPLAGSSAGQPPGMVVPLDAAAIRQVPAERPRPAFAVVTGHGLLAPLQVQKAGKRALYAEDFLRGERGLAGVCLGGG